MGQEDKSTASSISGLSNALCKASPRPFFCECAVSGGARHGTLPHFSGVGRPSQREAGEHWKALVLNLTRLDKGKKGCYYVVDTVCPQKQ